MALVTVEIIIIACLVALSCALPGVFLVLRKKSLMSDAISHAILFGIVIAFIITQTVNSPLSVIAAVLTGLLTVSLTEIVIRSRKLKEDAAISLVFPLLFSIGVVLINHFARGVHIDSDCVLFGELAFAPFKRWSIGSMDLGPLGLWVMGGILLLNVLFIVLFYKELMMSSFDPALAKSMGFFPTRLHYMLMLLVSITCVGAFEHVGSILVVAFMIVPACSAYLITKRLLPMLIVSAILAVVYALLGYLLSYQLDVNIAGSMVTVAGVVFVLIFTFAPDRGLFARLVLGRYNQWDLAVQTLAVHLWHAQVTKADLTETVVEHMVDHMRWSPAQVAEVIAQAIKQNIIQKQGQRLLLTDYGREKAKAVMIDA